MPAPAETAILDATERLLATRAFSELAVGDIIQAAGVSRTSFYAHFGSRAAVLAACLRRVVHEMTLAVSAPDAAPGADRAAVIRGRLERWAALARAHGPLLATVSAHWPHDAELAELWCATVAGFSAMTAAEVTRAREAQTAPPGADADALAAVLTWGYERVLHVALVGGAAGLADPAAIVDPLTQMTLGAAFGQPPPTTPDAS